jgi:hypothetical protein
VTIGPAAAAAAVLNEVVVLGVDAGRPDTTVFEVIEAVVVGAADDWAEDVVYGAVVSVASVD